MKIETMNNVFRKREKKKLLAPYSATWLQSTQCLTIAGRQGVDTLVKWRQLMYKNIFTLLT